MSEKQKLIPADLPAGHVREEAKKVVADQLAEEVENRSIEGGSFDPSTAFKVENEIAQHFNLETNGFEVTDAVQGYSYLWGRTAYRSDAEIKSRAQRLLGGRVPGFELVSGPRNSYPECWHLRQADGTRRIGDCQLYRVKTEVYNAINAKQALMAKARELGVSANLLQVAARHPQYVRATAVEGNPVDYIRERARTHGGIPRDSFDAAMIKTLTEHKIAEDAKNGNLYGIPVEKAVPRSN